MAKKRRNTTISACPVAEGVRFRVGSATAFAVRRESKDVALRIRRERRPLRAALERVPFLRGIARLFFAVGDLLDGISESAELKPQRVLQGSRFERAVARLFRAHPQSLVALGSAVMIPLLLAGLIAALPMSVETFVLPGRELSRAASNAIVCATRVVGALLAVMLCAQLRVVNRLCMYRGAINKVLNAYEADRRHVSQATAATASRVYRQSSAAFLTVVLLVSIVGFALVRTFTLPVQLLVRALIVMAAAAVVNEPVQALERLGTGHPLGKLLIPYLWIERIFVAEPHPEMLEVAVYAFNAARENNY